MRRWNGWGDEKTTYPLPESAAGYLAEVVGAGIPVRDAAFDDVLRSVPSSRLAPHPLISTDSRERLRHARGQSLPDWVALRSGRLEVFPDGVAFPTDDDDVRALLHVARQTGARLIPYGGGTSVVGHINPLPGEAPVLTVDLSHVNQLETLDESSRLATFGAGANGPQIEALLRARGYTLGHFPQSHELSTLGGWIATRSSGQQSHLYGRIEDLFAGGHLETLLGPLELPPHPASAAGPDLRQMVLGSEGRLGIITRAAVRVRPRPRHEQFNAFFFRTWPAGIAAAREIAQSGLTFSMARLSNTMETDTTLRLSGRDGLVNLARSGLRALGYGAQPCLLLLGFTSELRPDTAGGSERQAAMDIARAQGGLSVGTLIGEMWRKTRFLTPYLRNTFWERGYALDTLETAVPWAAVEPTAREITCAIQTASAEQNERVLVLAHLSHVYADGASIYVTCLFRRAADPDETLHGWRAMKAAASDAIVRQAGTISHQHGVGVDHAPYLAAEKGAVGMQLLEAACRALDPEGLLNPGKLLR